MENTESSIARPDGLVVQFVDQDDKLLDESTNTYFDIKIAFATVTILIVIFIAIGYIRGSRKS